MKKKITTDFHYERRVNLETLKFYQSKKDIVRYLYNTWKLESDISEDCGCRKSCGKRFCKWVLNAALLHIFQAKLVQNCSKLLQQTGVTWQQIMCCIVDVYIQ